MPASSSTRARSGSVPPEEPGLRVDQRGRERPKRLRALVDEVASRVEELLARERLRSGAVVRGSSDAHLDDVVGEARDLRAESLEPRPMERYVNFRRRALVPAAESEPCDRLPRLRCRD